MSNEKNRKIVVRLFEECINSGRLELLSELVAEHYTGPQGERGAAGFSRTIEALRGAFPDLHYTLEERVAEGDRVAVRWRWQGTNRNPFRGFPATGKTVTNTGIAIFQVQNDKIVQGVIETDRLGFLQAIGVVPEGIGAGPAPATK